MRRRRRPPAGVLASTMSGGSPPPVPPGVPLLWFDVTDYPLGHVLTSWESKGEAAVAATQQGTNAPEVTAAGPHGRKAARFDGAEYWLETGPLGVAAAQPYKVCAVGACDDANTEHSYLGQTGEFTLRTTIGPPQYFPTAGINQRVGTVVSGQIDALILTVNGAASSLMQNGAALTPPGSLGANTIHGGVGVRIGANSGPTPTLFLVGIVCEALLYGPGAPSDASIYNYLVRKWGAFPA